MKEIIFNLKSLQEIDNEILRIEKEKSNLVEKIKTLKEILKKSEEEIKEKKEKLAEAERWYYEKEKEFREEMEKIKKMQARLNALSKSKEFVAAQKEIETVKKIISQKEEETLKLLVAINDYKSSISNDEEKLNIMRKEVEKEDASTKEIIHKLNERLKKVKEKRKNYDEKIDEEIKSRYLRIQEAMNGIAVVEVRNGSCLGCHRQIPPQLYNILLRNETLETCPFCKRFIYVSEEILGKNKDSE